MVYNPMVMKDWGKNLMKNLIENKMKYWVENLI